MSTTLFAQSSGINDNINRDIFELSTKISPKQEKSSATFSIGAGYAGTNVERPDGFNIQLDLIFPVTTYLAINGSFNYARFPRYNTTRFYGPQNGDYLIDHGELNHVTLSPGLSFGNFKYKDKFNYFITAGFALGLGSVGKTIYTNMNGVTINTSSGGILDIIGILTSGRISYKISKQFQLFLEPSYYTVWSDDGKSNYHINGGVSLNL
jgi:hypothetical protein